jgi:hypothetical protein
MAAPAGAAQIGIRPANTGPIPEGPPQAVHLVEAPGENNHVTVQASDPIANVDQTDDFSTGWALTVTVTDPNATFDPTPPTGEIPCQVVSAHTARCSAPADDYFVQAIVDLGDGNNQLRFGPGSVPLRERFTSGDGSDDIATGPFAGDASYRWASDTGGGNDIVRIGPAVRDGFGGAPAGSTSGLALYAGTGDDIVTAANGAFDEVNCGPGNDTLLADPFDIESVYVEDGGSCETRVLPGTG